LAKEENEAIHMQSRSDVNMTTDGTATVPNSGRLTPKRLTERQRRLREGILVAARALITEKGYEGVNMRDLAAAAKVTPKTLYYQFGSKEDLLRSAVEDMFQRLYTAMDDEPIGRGVDRMFYIIDKVTELTNAHRAYAQALMPLFAGNEPATFTVIRRRTYNKALMQIADEGDFLDWVDVSVMTSLIYKQVNPIYQAAWYARVPLEVTRQVAKHDIALMIAASSRGYSHDKAIETAIDMQRLLKGSPFI